MRILIIIGFLILYGQQTKGQTFLAAYKKYRLAQADNFTIKKTRKSIKRFIKSQIMETDSIFQSYKTKTGFDFNTADSLFLIYQSPAESPFTNSVIIWSGKDTISYQQGFSMIKPNRYKRTITYTSFIPQVERSIGFKTVTEQDSLIILVSNQKLSSIEHLGDNQQINDGSITNVYIAFKRNGEYQIKSCSPPKFMIQTSWQRD